MAWRRYYFIWLRIRFFHRSLYFQYGLFWILNFHILLVNLRDSFIVFTANEWVVIIFFMIICLRCWFYDNLARLIPYQLGFLLSTLRPQTLMFFGRLLKNWCYQFTSYLLPLIHLKRVILISQKTIINNIYMTIKKVKSRNKWELKFQSFL